MTSITGIKEAYKQTTLKEKNNLNILTGESVKNRNLFHGIQRTISELCIMIKSIFTKRGDLNNIEINYQNDLSTIMGYIKLHKKLNIKIPDNLPNKKVLYKEIRKHSKADQRNKFTLDLAKLTYIHPIYFKQSKPKIHTNLNAPDGYIIHTEKGIYLIDSKRNINKDSLILSKYDIDILSEEWDKNELAVKSFKYLFEDIKEKKSIKSNTNATLLHSEEIENFKDECLKIKKDILIDKHKIEQNIISINIKLNVIIKIELHKNKSLFNNELSHIKVESEKIHLTNKKDELIKKIEQCNKQLEQVESLLNPVL